MKSRAFHAKMFNDPYVQGLSLAERWLYTYYLFNERVNWIGCYEVTDRMVLFEAGEGISQETLKKAKERFSKDGKIIFSEGYVIIKNSEKYETHMHNIQLMGSALKQFKELPDRVKDMFLKVKPLEVIEAYRASFEELHYILSVSYSVGYSVEYAVDEGKGKEESNKDNNEDLEEKKKNKYSSIDDIGLEEVGEMAMKLQVPQAEIIKCLEELEDWCASKSKKFDNYLAALRNWVRRKKDEGKIKAAPVQHLPEDTGTHSVPYSMRQDLTSKMSMP